MDAFFFDFVRKKRFDREWFFMDVMLKLAVILLVGVIGGKLARMVKLPEVSGYLLFGLFLSPSLIGLLFGDGVRFLTETDIDNFTIISEIALAVIAFSIGSEFLLKDLRKVGKSIMIITLTEVVGAIGLVFSVMYFLFDQTFAFSIVLASMSAATAPAATLLVMRQYRAKGPVTSTVLPVVAMDDVYGIAAFGIAVSLAMTSLSPDASLGMMILEPIIEIGGSLLLGFALGFILSRISKKAQNRDMMKAIAIGFIIGAVGLAKELGFSPLLTNIVMGTTMVNLDRHAHRTFNLVNEFISPFFILFFTIAGASLHLEVLATVGWMGVAYIFARGIGKWAGATFGAVVMKSPKTVQKYMGLALLPQGGISIGLSVLVRQMFTPELAGPMATNIITIIMASVLIYETTGPIFAKLAIGLAGEINGQDVPTPAAGTEVPVSA
jgi:Kef-type K+ transport system membrane component KefB